MPNTGLHNNDSVVFIDLTIASRDHSSHSAANNLHLLRLSLLVLEFCSEPLGDPAKTKTKHEDDSNEERDEAQKEVSVWRFKDTIIQGLRTVDWSDLEIII